MSGRRLSRAAGDGRPAPPVRLVHLGLGNFFRAHQVWFTEHADDASEWGYAAWAGRSAASAAALAAQGGLYTVVRRGPHDDEVELVGALSETYPAAAHREWLRALASPQLAVVTVTVTEAGYLRAPGGRLDLAAPAVAADVAALRADPEAPVATAPARLLAGLAARRRAGAGPLALVPCDNLPGNGAVVRQVLSDLAERVGPTLHAALDEQAEVVATVVDRITPAATAADAEVVAQRTGWRDDAVVVTEPYAEWILSGRFPAGRPSWEASGARVVADATCYERRKLWILNGAHSLLAYAGSIRGHATVAEAVADDTCRAWIEAWWRDAVPHLFGRTGEVAAPGAAGDAPWDAGELGRYQESVVDRFANRRLDDRLDRIAQDGSQKLPVRVVPVVRAEREAGRMPAGGARILAAWTCHLRGRGAPVRDVRAAELAAAASGPLEQAVRAVLGLLDPGLAEDRQLAAVVAELCRALEAAGVGAGPPR